MVVVRFTNGRVPLMLYGIFDAREAGETQTGVEATEPEGRGQTMFSHPSTVLGPL